MITDRALYFNQTFYAGKKGKKKGQVMNLGEFLGGDGGVYRAPGSAATTTVAVSSNWADEMDEADADDARTQRLQQVLGPLTRYRYRYR